MRTFDKILAWALLGVGAVHAAGKLVPLPYGIGSGWPVMLDAIIVLAALLNIIRTRVRRGFERGSSIFANILLAFLIGRATWYLYHQVLHMPQVIAIWMLTASELALSFRSRQ